MSQPHCRSISACLLVYLLVPGTALAQSVLYVDDDASTNGDGLTWDTAYNYLQDALSARPRSNCSTPWNSRGATPGSPILTILTSGTSRSSRPPSAATSPVTMGLTSPTTRRTATT